MYQYRWHCYVKNGRWRDFMTVMTAVSELHEKRGYRPVRFLNGVVGKANYFVAQADYPSLAAWEEEMAAMSQDVELMDALRSTAELMDETEIHELLSDAPTIA